MRRYFLDSLVALQVASRYIQRNVGRVDYAMQQSQKIGHDAFYRIGNKHLIAIELYFVALQVEVAFYFRKVENTRQVERIVHIQMNVEKRFGGIRV